jgi:hypothetical protein
LEEWNIQTSLVVFRKENPTISFQEAVIMDDDLAKTHMMIPLLAVTAAFTGISWSFASFAFVTLNTERTDEVAM